MAPKLLETDKGFVCPLCGCSLPKKVWRTRGCFGAGMVGGKKNAMRHLRACGIIKKRRSAGGECGIINPGMNPEG